MSRSYTLVKHTKICSYCKNEFVSKLGETVCGACATAENLKEMKERIMQSAIMMGMPPGTDMSIILNNMSRMLELMKTQIDKTGSDL